METILIAIGGNSLIKDSAKVSVNDQYDAIKHTAKSLVSLLKDNYKILITHGNGPQVGSALRRSEISNQVEKMPLVPLSSCVSDTQGSIGFQIQTALENECSNKQISVNTATIISRTIVNEDDPGFQNPTKPIGTFYTKEESDELKQEYPDWKFMEDAGRGYRRIVPSPVPIEVIETDQIKKLLENGTTVIAGGGGGIPFIKQKGELVAVDAVIDKDLASVTLGSNLGIKKLIISTAVDNVYINFGKPEQRKLETVDKKTIEKYTQEGHFASGSMLPKIKAAILFLENGGEEVVITSPKNIEKALKEGLGTKITK